jgi:O-methyltransferase
MFYGNFSGEKKSAFSNSLETFNACFSRVYAADNLITFNRNLTFTQDDKFNTSFEHNAVTKQEHSLKWRIHTLCWAASHCLSLEGDFVECGVYLGFSMSVVAEYLNFSQVKKKMYLYDTYSGIPDEYNSELRSNKVYENTPNMYEKVMNKFRKYNNILPIKGQVPDSFNINCPQKIAFLHIDMNSSKSEIAALESLFDKISIGGIIIFDDFGWMGYDQQTLAEIEWLGKRDHKILELPTGQGMIIKKGN